MAVLLDVNVLPRGPASRTRRLRDAFVEGYREAHPDAQVVQVDLADVHVTLPETDEWDVQAKFEMLYGEGKLDEKTAARWNRLTEMTDKLHAADAVVVSAPTWNFTVPWHLKRWLDAVVQPRLTFEITDQGYHGLLEGRPAAMLITRDGKYGPGSGHEDLEFHTTYLRGVLGFMGLGPIHEVVAEPLAMEGPEVAARALEDATARARALGRSL